MAPTSLATTKRNLTALDIIRAHSPIPGREDIAFLLQEAMREQGWQGSRLDANRERIEQQQKSSKNAHDLKLAIARVLDLEDSWWGPSATEEEMTLKETDIDVGDIEELKPLAVGSGYVKLISPEVVQNDDWSTMLVYSPNALPNILRSLITDFRPSLRNADPARSLFLLCRFASLWGDPEWLEELIASSVDKIEETVYVSSWSNSSVSILNSHRHLLRIYHV